MATEEMVWHNDGHIMHLQLNKESVVITHITCPGGDCQHKDRCIVEWFLRRYGLECNVGVCAPSENMLIAWTVVGDPTDFDLCQVWTIPIDDEAFAAWLATQEIKDYSPEDTD